MNFIDKLLDSIEKKIDIVYDLIISFKKFRFKDWKYRSQFIMGIILIIFSVFLYSIAYLLTKDTGIFFELLRSIAFVPIELFFVTIVLQELLTRHEKQIRHQTLNMTIGIFFYEVGTQFLKICRQYETDKSISKNLSITINWRTTDFIKAIQLYKNKTIKMDCTIGDVEQLQAFLIEKRDFLQVQMQNPNLIEHENFTDMLWSVFHMADELAWRGDLKKLTQQDFSHVSEDIERAYKLVILQWIDYMRYLKRFYPYIFGFAVKKSPFAEDNGVW